MADGTKIEWTDATWNPIRARIKGSDRWGYHCERVSPGCKLCYASAMNQRTFPAWGTGLDYTVPNRAKVEIFVDEDELLKPLQWRKARKIFPCSMTDWCAEFVTEEMRDQMLAVAALCPQHTFLFLTKRADLCAEYFADELRTFYLEGHAQSIYQKLHPNEHWESIAMNIAVQEIYMQHVFLGFSAENQYNFDWRWNCMRKLAAADWQVWCSAEPLLNEIDMSAALREGLSWVVAGGESGHGARPLHPDWARGLRNQCQAAGVPFFFKQWGEWAPKQSFSGFRAWDLAGAHGLLQRSGQFDVVTGRDVPDYEFGLTCADLDGNDGAAAMARCGKKAAGRLLDGREWSEFPEGL